MSGTWPQVIRVGGIVVWSIKAYKERLLGIQILDWWVCRSKLPSQLSPLLTLEIGSTWERQFFLGPWVAMWLQGSLGEYWSSKLVAGPLKAALTQLSFIQ